MLRIYLLVFIGIIANVAWAQSPNKFTYQAIVRDTGTNAVFSSQNIGMRLSIMQGSSQSAPVYSETFSTSSNSGGLITVLIGDGVVVSGNFSTIDWSNGPFFILTETDPTGANNYTISGTSQLLSVPYSLFSNSSVKAAIADSALVANQADTATIALNAYWKRNGSKIHYDGGNVGIGTNNPLASGLHIKMLNATIRMEDTDSQAGDVYGMVNNTLGNGVLNFAIYNFTDAVPELSFKGDGDVAIQNGDLGIGNTNPKSKLHVTNGDVYIESIGKGVIMKSPNGNCWRMTVDNLGQPVFLSVTCP